MSTAYIDTSVLVAIETSQPDANVYEQELGKYVGLCHQICWKQNIAQSACERGVHLQTSV